MSCCHGHGHGHGTWCHGGYGYPPPDYEERAYGPRRGRRGRWVPDEDDLASYLADLEAEIAAVRRDLEASRRSSSGEA